MQELVSNMYFPTQRTGKLGKKPFQAGIVVSIKSTIALYEELKSEGVPWFMTSRINQDGLENLFSTLRFMGGNDFHPSARDFANRIRTLCLTRNIDLVIQNPSVEIVNDGDEYISSQIFDTASIHPSTSDQLEGVINYFLYFFNSYNL